MRHPRYLALIVVSAALAAGSCATHRQIRSSALEFLYPAGAPAAPAGDVLLKLPVRAGLAFAPPGTPRGETFTETQKQELLSRVAAAFSRREGIASVEVIPSSHLRPAGGFANLDQLAAAFGIDLVALISYDQFQFSETARSSWAYWTIVGAYFVKGEKNETRTLLDAVVYHIGSRAMLFHATGQSGVKGAATPVDLARALRLDSEEGFRRAIDDLIVNLEGALGKFQEQAATGTVRGAGTPAVAMRDASGRPVSPAPAGGGGALGAGEAGAALLLAILGWTGRRRERRG